MGISDPTFGAVLMVLLLGLAGIVLAVLIRMRAVERREQFDREEKSGSLNQR